MPGLALLVTELAMVPDRPGQGGCGTCSRCLDACPTGALEAPYVLRADRCLAYLTIEERGAIPTELRGAVGDWVFGCDTCQQVCPHNHRPHPAADAALDSCQGAGAYLDLERLLTIEDADAYLGRLQGTALTRPGREGLIRNGCLAVARLGLVDLSPLLCRLLLSDPSPLVRGHAAWALGRLNDPRCRERLLDASAAEADPAVLQEIRRAVAGDAGL
ncbi:MAG: HEAT repeat domain-containing protein [Candidatus Riflebacteria bacterium]|nr:HEAT repeat domain-containing protein [Candidatus Riflebacteria bacterium]